MTRLARIIAQSLSDTEAQALWFLSKFGTHEENSLLQTLRDMRLIHNPNAAGLPELTTLGVEVLAAVKEEEKRHNAGIPNRRTA